MSGAVVGCAGLEVMGDEGVIPYRYSYYMSNSLWKYVFLLPDTPSNHIVIYHHDFILYILFS